MSACRISAISSRGSTRTEESGTLGLSDELSHPVKIAAIIASEEALTLAADELLLDLEHRAELNAVSPKLRQDAMTLFIQARKLLDDFAGTLPALAPPKKKPYLGPRTRFHETEEVLPNNNGKLKRR